MSFPLEVYKRTSLRITTLLGYARCSTDRQDLAAQPATLADLGVVSDRTHTDHGLTATNRARPKRLRPCGTATRCWCPSSIGWPSR